MQLFNNIPAFGVWNNYTQSVQRMRDAMEKLSSGSRIRFAGDDPAGLAMSERMRAQIRNASSASQNIQNQMSYLRTGDSWLQKVQDILGRMSELAVASNDGTKTEADRANLQEEFQQMQQEILRITSGSTAAGKYNTANLFDGAAPYVQIGPDSGQLFATTAISLQRNSTAALGETATFWSAGTTGVVGNSPANVTWGSILNRGSAVDGTGGINVSTQAQAQRAGAFVNLAIDFVSRQRAILGAQASRLGYALEGVRNYEENIRSAESQIRDVDVAFEATEFARNQILTQIGTAMLAQANALPQRVLDLIG